MKNQELQSSLVKSGIILIFCVFLIYAFGASDSGGITGTIFSLFSAIKFLVGLTFAIIISIAVMFGIYFGILFLYNPNTCSKIYAEFKEKLADSSKFISSTCATKCSSKKEFVVPVSDKDLSPLRSNQDKLGSQISGLQDSVASLEKTLSSVSSSITGTTEEIAKLDEKVASAEEELESKATTASVDDATKKLAADIAAIQGSVKPLGDKITELETTLASLGNDDEDSGDDLQEKVDTAISDMKAELATMQSSIKKLAAAPVAAVPSTKPKAKQAAKKTEEAPHKILAYFKKKNDENKFIKVVGDSVAKGMTYAQIGKALKESLSAEAAKVTDGHPSLTKDYIKVCRNNS